MQFSIDKKLINEVVDRVSGSLAKASSANDPCQYIGVSTQKDELTLSVISQNLVSKAILKRTELTSSLFEITKSGDCAVDGALASKTLRVGSAEKKITFDLKPSAVVTQPEKTEDSEEGESASAPATPAVIGTLHLSMPSLTLGRTDEFTLNSVQAFAWPSLEVNEATKVVFKAPELIKYVGKLGQAAGAETMNDNYSNILIRVSDTVELVTTNGQQLLIATILGEGQKGEYVLPYAALQSLMKMIDGNADVEMYLAKQGKFVVFRQPMFYAAQPVGTVEYRLPLFDKFQKYEKKVNFLDFKLTCKCHKSNLKLASDTLNLIEDKKTRSFFDVENKLISTKKNDPRGTQTLAIPITDAQGDGLTLDISSSHLAVAVALTEVDEVEIKLSGKHSLGLMILGPNLKQYFAPYLED